MYNQCTYTCRRGTTTGRLRPQVRQKGKRHGDREERPLQRRQEHEQRYRVQRLCIQPRHQQCLRQTIPNGKETRLFSFQRFQTLC